MINIMPNNNNNGDDGGGGGAIAIFFIIFIIIIAGGVLFWYFVWKHFKTQSSNAQTNYTQGRQMCIDEFKDNSKDKEKCLHDVIKQKKEDDKKQVHEEEGLAATMLISQALNH